EVQVAVADLPLLHPGDRGFDRPAGLLQGQAVRPPHADLRRPRRRTGIGLRAQLAGGRTDADVRALTAVHGVGGLAEDLLLASAAVQAVGAGPTHQEILAPSAGLVVGAGPAVHGVVAEPAVH